MRRGVVPARALDEDGARAGDQPAEQGQPRMSDLAMKRTGLTAWITQMSSQETWFVTTRRWGVTAWHAPVHVQPDVERANSPRDQ